MPTGQCALCLKQRPIIKSHFIAAGFQRRLRTPGVKDQRPVAMTATITKLNDRPVQEQLLCYHCDQRLARYGENWMMKNAFDGKTFPLLEKVRLAIPISAYSFPDALAYSGDWLGIDTEKLAYFALSMLWRAAVREWRISRTETLSVEISEFRKEAMRRYLLGETPFPTAFAVMATVCTDRMSQGNIFAPCEVLGGAWRPAYGLLVLGIYFRIFIGANLPRAVRYKCCVTSPHKIIFLRNCEDVSMAASSSLFPTTRLIAPLPVTPILAVQRP